MKPITLKEYGDEAAPHIAIRLHTDFTPGYGTNHGYKHLIANVVEVVSGPSIRNLSDSQPLCDVEVSLQMDDTSKAFYGREVQVHASYTYIGVTRAKVILSTLQTINRRLDQITSKYGYADTTAQYLLRFADAVGADVFIVGSSGSHGTYDAGAWRELEPHIAQSWIDSREREALEAFHPETKE